MFYAIYHVYSLCTGILLQAIVQNNLVEETGTTEFTRGAYMETIFATKLLDL